MRYRNTDRGDEPRERRDGAKRRSFLKSAGAAGMAGALGWSGSAPALADAVADWPSPADPYYASLVSDLKAVGVPAGEFVYADSEADTAAAYSVDGDVAETSSLAVGDDLPFSRATRVSLTEEPANSYSVTYKATATETAIASGDTLLGVVYLRGPESSETEPTVQYVAKDEDNLSTNMVANQAQVRPGAEWTRYYFPMQFSYDAEAGTWRTEMFLGFGRQTVDIGGMAVIHFGDVTAPDQLPSGPAQSAGGSEGGGDWEAAADERIRDHRMADFTIKVVDAEGNPVPEADVGVSMRAHDFSFGGVLSADHLIQETEEGDPYRENLTRLFNKVWFGNYHKWRFWESETSVSDAATQWAVDNGLDIRGHVCLWSNVSAWAVPPDVVRAMGVEWEANGVTDPELDPGHVRERTTQHVRDIVEHYEGQINEWEVVNELTHQPGMVRAANGVPADEPMEGNPLTADIIAEWYNAAREAGGEEMRLNVNDYNVLGGPHFSTRDDYVTQIEFLQENATLDGVGLQCHLSESSALTPGQTLEGLNRYAEHGVSLRITEFDMADENWAEADKADFFGDFLKAAFSHEAVEEFTISGMLSSRHWRDDAPFWGETFDDPKPSLAVYENLVFDEWWTDETGRTGSNGAYATRGFKGEYEITASRGDSTATETVTLSDGGATVELALGAETRENSGTNDADGGTTASEGTPGFGLGAALAGLASGAYLRCRTADNTEERD